MDPSPPPDVRTLWADLFEAHGTALTRRLGALFPGVDPELLADAVVDATRSLAEAYGRFDRDRGDLPAFLLGMARRGLARLLRRDRRRRRREEKKAAGLVTDSASAGRSPADELADREDLRRAVLELAATEEERGELALFLAGEDDPGVWAELLGLRQTSEEEQRAGMGRALARWRQRICRYRRRSRRRKEGS